VGGTVADRKRLLCATAGNLRHNHLYIGGHYDFFPADCVGPSRRSAKPSNGEFEVVLDGLNETIHTDIGSSAATGKPRGFFRGRTWVKQLYAYHGIKTGDVLALERIGKRSYRMYPFDAKNARDDQ
jgi:hypothetical protein